MQISLILQVCFEHLICVIFLCLMLAWENLARQFRGNFEFEISLKTWILKQFNFEVVLEPWSSFQFYKKCNILKPF